MTKSPKCHSIVGENSEKRIPLIGRIDQEITEVTCEKTRKCRAKCQGIGNQPPKLVVEKKPNPEKNDVTFATKNHCVTLGGIGVFVTELGPAEIGDKTMLWE